MKATILKLKLRLRLSLRLKVETIPVPLRPVQVSSIDILRKVLN